MTNARDRFPPEVEQHLQQIGWYPGRAVTSDIASWSNRLQQRGWSAPFAAAEAALNEFGGLRSELSGAGQSMGRTPFELDPTLVEDDLDVIEDFQTDMSVSLYPLGYVDHGHMFLVIDPKGRVYMVNHRAVYLGPNLDEALTKLILGIKPEQEPPTP